MFTRLLGNNFILLNLAEKNRQDRCQGEFLETRTVNACNNDMLYYHMMVVLLGTVIGFSSQLGHLEQSFNARTKELIS